MSILEIKDLHASVDHTGGRRQGDPHRRRPDRPGRRDARDHGSERVRQVDPGLRRRRAPEVPGDLGQHHAGRRHVLAMTVDERARAGLFLAMQYPVEVPGVSTSNFLRSAATAVRGEAPKLRTWVKEVKQAMSELEIAPTSPSATSTRASPAARRSGTRCCSSRCSSPRSRSSTRPTPGSTWTRCGWSVRRGQPLPRGRRDRGAADHALHPDPAAHHPRRGARVRRRPHRRVRWPRPGRRAGETGYVRFTGVAEAAV